MHSILLGITKLILILATATLVACSSAHEAEDRCLDGWYSGTAELGCFADKAAWALAEYRLCIDSADNVDELQECETEFKHNIAK